MDGTIKHTLEGKYSTLHALWKLKHTLPFQFSGFLQKNQCFWLLQVDDDSTHHLESDTFYSIATAVHQQEYCAGNADHSWVNKREGLPSDKTKKCTNSSVWCTCWVYAPASCESSLFGTPLILFFVIYRSTPPYTPSRVPRPSPALFS